MNSSNASSDYKQTKPQTAKASSTTPHIRHPSASDNEQKEGEEWETASESSANMRPIHTDTNQQPTTKPTVHDTKSTNRDRTPPKKSFASQRYIFIITHRIDLNRFSYRPTNTRYNEAGIHRRTHNLHDRSGKTTRAIVHRTSRSATNTKTSSVKNPDSET